MKRDHGSRTAVAVGLDMSWKHNRAECRSYIEMENLDLVIVDSWAYQRHHGATMTTVGGWSGPVSTEHQYNLIGAADAGAAGAGAAVVVAAAAADLPGRIGYCSRNHDLVEDEKS